MPVLADNIYFPSFSRTIGQMRKELQFFDKNINIEIAVCLNGINSRAEIIQNLRGIIFRNNHLFNKVNFIFRNEAGKSGAINRLVEYARQKEFELIHFVDDDLEFAEGSMWENIKTLKNSSAHLFVAGSHFQVKEKTLKEIYCSTKSYFSALKQWFCHNVFIAPFHKDAHKPYFISGQSWAARVSDIPELPVDTLITDDTYISNYFAVKGKKKYLVDNQHVLVKPAESIVYFKLPQSFREWKKQQIRIYAGVISAFEHFSEHRVFLEKYFSWAYAYNKGSKVFYKEIRIKRDIFYQLFRMSQRYMMYSADRIIKKGKHVSWNTACSTK